MNPKCMIPAGGDQSQDKAPTSAQAHVKPCTLKRAAQTRMPFPKPKTVKAWASNTQRLRGRNLPAHHLSHLQRKAPPWTLASFQHRHCHKAWCSQPAGAPWLQTPRQGSTRT